MHRRGITELLKNYRRVWVNGQIPYENYQKEPQEEIYQRFQKFVDEKADCFERSCLEGHITGSALLVSRDWQKVLLLHHRKLGKWLQLGGHADGAPDAARVALKEAREESGLTHLEFIAYQHDLALELGDKPIPFDLDIHVIPARKQEPAHLHYDLRFLLIHTGSDTPIKNEEANELRWLDLVEAAKLTDEPSMLRQFAKLKALRQARFSGSR